MNRRLDQFQRTDPQIQVFNDRERLHSRGEPAPARASCFCASSESEKPAASARTSSGSGASAAAIGAARWRAGRAQAGAVWTVW